MPPKSLKTTLVKQFSYNGSVKANAFIFGARKYTTTSYIKIELKLPCDNTAEFLPEL